MQRISIAGDRLVMFTQGIKGVAEIVMRLGIVRVYAEGFSTSDDFFFSLKLLQRLEKMTGFEALTAAALFNSLTAVW